MTLLGIAFAQKLHSFLIGGLNVMLAYLDTIMAFTVIMLGFSLMITILNQTVSAFLGYRGTNLRWGIQTMLQTLDSKLGAEAETIANKLLTECVVSDSIFARYASLEKIPLLGRLVRRWRLATALGPDALVHFLIKYKDNPSLLIKNNDPNLAKVQTAIGDLLKAVDANTQRKLDQVFAAFNAPAAPGAPTAPGAIKPNYELRIDDFLTQLGNSVQQSVGEIEAWFDMVMKRASQRFTMQIRIWTVVFAFLLAFGIHLDSLKLFNDLLGNPALRQKLVDQSEAMLKEADAVLGAPTAGGQSSELTVSPEVLQGQMKELIDKDIDKNTEAKPELLGDLPKFNNIPEADTWLQNNLKPEVNQDRKEELSAKYRGRVISGLRIKAKDISDLFQKAGLQLLPTDRTLPRWNSLSGWKAFFWPDSKRNLFGILVSAGLLSLGAPFWYNALKTLSNLRPMVASKQEKQKQEIASS